MNDLPVKRLAAMCFFAITITLAPWGMASAAKLVLKDGTVIQGEIDSLKDAVYTVESKSLGTLQIRQEDVQIIDHGAASAAAIGAPTSAPMAESNQLKAVQSKLAQDPTLLSKVEALQSDPEVQAILNDPEIMSTIASGDYLALMNHPKIIALTQNSKIREVIDSAK